MFKQIIFITALISSFSTYGMDKQNNEENVFKSLMNEPIQKALGKEALNKVIIANSTAPVAKKSNLKESNLFIFYRKNVAGQRSKL